MHLRNLCHITRCCYNTSRYPSRTSLLLYSTPQSTVRRTMATAMGKRLSGKTVVITGASSGIGRSTAFEFARTAPKDLKLILTARRVDTLKQVAEDIKKEVGEGVKVLPVQLDQSKSSEVKQFVSKLPAEFKEIDILVNNAWVSSCTERVMTDTSQRSRQRRCQSARDRRRRHQHHGQHQL